MSSDTLLFMAVCVGWPAMLMFTSSPASTPPPSSDPIEAASVASTAALRAIIADFKQHGVVVVPGVVDSASIDAIRSSFHASLRQHGCDVNDLPQTGIPSFCINKIRAFAYTDACACSTNRTHTLFSLGTAKHLGKLSSTGRAVVVMYSTWPHAIQRSAHTGYSRVG